MVQIILQLIIQGIQGIQEKSATDLLSMFRKTKMPPCAEAFSIPFIKN